MYVFFIRDVLLIEVIHVYLLLAVGGSEELEEVALELVAVFGNVLARVFADQQHLPHM